MSAPWRSVIPLPLGIWNQGRVEGGEAWHGTIPAFILCDPGLISSLSAPEFLRLCNEGPVLTSRFLDILTQWFCACSWVCTAITIHWGIR